MFQRFLSYLQLDRTFLLLIFLFSYFLVISNRVQAGVISWFTLTPEGPLAQFVSAVLIFLLVRYWMNRVEQQDTQRTWRQYTAITAMSLIGYLLLTNTMSLLIALAFDTVGRNFNAETLLATNLNSVINVVLYGGIYLAYCHYQKLSRYQLQLEQYNQQVAQLKIQQLKAQLNPHFVFNSLNTLDELIMVDPQHASDYLHHFADLYRLSLNSAEQQLIPVSEEIEFSVHYFKLMQVRLGEGYQLQIDNLEHSNATRLPPFTLQVLLENVFLHNTASSAAPLLVTITLSADNLSVSHLRQEKVKPQHSNGIGLKNLARQLHFLTGRSLQIVSDDQHFSVMVPLVTEDTACTTW